MSLLSGFGAKIEKIIDFWLRGQFLEKKWFFRDFLEIPRGGYGKTEILVGIPILILVGAPKTGGTPIWGGQKVEKTTFYDFSVKETTFSWFFTLFSVFFGVNVTNLVGVSCINWT